MKKIELLCPAGNFEMLKAAIHNGADAVYLSGNKYGARKFANNFNEDEIIEAIKYAHLYGVKVYITINTLIKDNEVEEFINFVEFIHKNNVDAVIMQDLGMMNLVRNIFPNLEIHASTQFHNHNIEDLNFLKSIGIKRAVLARELTIEEIKKLNIDIEKEVFVHGALCICYSGQCLMSSLIMNRSGNRGECAGMCRLKYSLLENNKKVDTNGEYLLSPKELFTLENLSELLEIGIDSIKIEGRMKSTEYVAYVTKLYRRAIDAYYNNEKINITKKEIDNLKVIFNREFTQGFLFKDNNFINQYSPNHLGIKIGEVIDVTSKKIKIKLNSEINQGDAIRFKNANLGLYANFIYDKNQKLINVAYKNNIIYLDNKINLKEKDIVLKTIDSKLIKEINSYPDKRIPININIIAKLNEKLKIEFSDDINSVSEYGNVVSTAITQPTTKEIIEEKISKLGNSIYNILNINIDIDNNIFIPVKEINDLRRKLIEKLNDIRSNKKNDFIKKDFDYKKLNIIPTNELSIFTNEEKDIEEYCNNNINIYTENKDIYKKYENTYYRLPRVINNFKEFKNERLLTNDIGSIFKYKYNNEIVSDIYSNVTNIYTIAFLLENGVKKVSISPELSIKESIELYNNFINKFKYIPNIEIFIFGRIELMILKHCILKTNINKKEYCNVCKNNNEYELVDRNNKKYKIISKNCNNIILNHKINNNLKEIHNCNGINYSISLINIKDNEEVKEFVREWKSDKNNNSRRRGNMDKGI